MKPPIICSYGMGVNSTALLIALAKANQIPDLILSADTGGEKPETYNFVWTFNAWLLAHGMPTITVCRKRSMYDSLEDNCLKKDMLPSRAYGWSSCAEKWKIAPMNYFCNHWEPARRCWEGGGKVIKLLGIDAGESRRAKITEDEKYLYCYPLIDWNWCREECVAMIKSVGLPVPMKSACFFCPASTKKEVLWLANKHSNLSARAVAMERRAAPNLRTVVGLGRHWSWEQLILGNVEALNAREDTAVGCACFDGDEEE